MRFGIIAEGYNDQKVICAVLKKILGIDSCDVQKIRPIEQFDETDNQAMQFSSWQLVLETCKDEEKLKAYFEAFEEDAVAIVHIDTAERNEPGFEVTDPLRSGHPDWVEYSMAVRANVRSKIEQLIPEMYRERFAYAIAVEETDAWLIPLFDTQGKGDTANAADPKRKFESLIGALKQKDRNKYLSDGVNYANVSKLLAQKKNLEACRKRNKSLDDFCNELEVLGQNL